MRRTLSTEGPTEEGARAGLGSAPGTAVPWNGGETAARRSAAILPMLR
jgi:hypothetical protein